jgi:3-hydroxybutyryl-CoA dehydrogenase
MKCIALGTDEQFAALTKNAPGIVFTQANSISELISNNSYDAYFNLSNTAALENYSTINAPIFINSVAYTLQEINATTNIFRLNAWNGFIEKKYWEVAGEKTDIINAIAKALGKDLQFQKDAIGFVSCNTISMIINEAYFALEDNVSTKSDIDTAMKLGTGYPFGPFEWAEIIGKNEIISLLEKLSVFNKIYTPSKYLKQE